MWSCLLGLERQRLAPIAFCRMASAPHLDHEFGAIGPDLDAGIAPRREILVAPFADKTRERRILALRGHCGAEEKQEAEQANDS